MTNEGIYKDVPFTYLIGWSKHNLWYYGCRFAKGCKPDDLWTKYFTSSIGKDDIKGVREYRQEFGEPDVIRVRKTFNNKEDCLSWEFRVLRRMKVKNDPKFINRSNGNKLFRQTGYVHSDETKQKLRTWERTEAYKQKLKDAAKSKPDIKDSTRKLMSIAHSKPYTEERKLQHTETMRNLSEESRKRCGHNKGKHLSEETKAKLRKPKKRTT